MARSNHWSEAEITLLKTSATAKEIAAQLPGRSEEAIMHKRQRLGIHGTRTAPMKPAPKAESPVSAPASEKLSIETQPGKSVIDSVSSKISTLEELLVHAKVDLNVWEVERHTINKWEVAMREPATTVGGAGDKALIVTNEDGGRHTLWTRGSNVPVHENLFQVKVWLRRKVLETRVQSIVDGMLEAFAKAAPVQPLAAPGVENGLLMEVSIFDLHLGKLVWAKESGTNYDTKIAQSGFRDALDTLLHRAQGFKIGRILFPVGNDFFNVDNAARTTTNGTPQDEEGRWQKSFVMGRALMVEAINKLRNIAPVDVVMVSGNHDRERVFYLGDSLAGWFSKTEGVTVDNEPSLRKYYQYGQCLLGFTHGNNEPHKNLPLIMATEQAKKWAATKFREFHLGHWHHKKETHFQPVNEFNGIRVRIIPSLCPADAWHNMKGYEGLRAAEVYLWDQNHGCIGSFSYTP